MRWGNRRHDGQPRGERGQATAELAMLLPVIVLLLVGTLELGRVFNAWIVVTQASREGARVGAAQCAVNAGCATSVGVWVTNSLSGLDAANATWDMTVGPYTSGGTLEVMVNYDVPVVTPIIGALIGNTVAVHGATSMRIE